jgi:alcohol dehydrogenase class IV
MACCHGYAASPGGESVFSIDASALSFGAGALDEVGEHARASGCKRVALFTDRRLAALSPLARAKASLAAAGVDVAVYDEVHVEPTDASFLAAARFATEGAFDGYVSVGGGSVIDTCKAAALYATYPAPLLAYVNAPIGEGRAIPGPLPPHFACPTTSGTGSECTGIAVFDLVEQRVKTAIASRRLRPTAALVDPSVTATLPAEVVAASGFDVLSHALESYTARAYTARPRSPSPGARPMSQGRNPWSDQGAMEALALSGQYLVRATRDAADAEARESMMWAATLAGIAFGNAGVHLPHGMSYAIAGGVRSFHMSGYPDHEPMVPHGVSVIVSAPAVFRFTAKTSPERHLAAATALGADTRGATPDDAGEVLAGRIAELMRETSMPNGASGVGYDERDVAALATGALAQARLVSNAPCPVDREAMEALFRAAMVAW